MPSLRLGSIAPGKCIEERVSRIDRGLPITQLRLTFFFFFFCQLDLQILRPKPPRGPSSSMTLLATTGLSCSPIPPILVSIILWGSTTELQLWYTTWVSHHSLTTLAPVCTTELGLVAALEDEFAARGVKPIGLSANDLESHEKWIADINDISQTNLSFPIIADADREVATLYDMLDYQDLTNRDLKGIPFTVRSVFIIDPKKTIRLTLTYPASTGRNFDEILRVIDSLQLGDKYRVTTPGNWKKVRYIYTYLARPVIQIFVLGWLCFPLCRVMMSLSIPVSPTKKLKSYSLNTAQSGHIFAWPSHPFKR